MTAHTIRHLLAGALLAAGVSSCAAGADKPLPGGPQVVTVTLTEYRITYSPAVAAGRVVFRFENAGKLVHQPDLLPLGEEVPPINEQLGGDQRVAVAPFAGIPPRNPGETGSFAVDLNPGQRYAFVCFARDLDGSSHALKGMTAEFRTGGAPTTTTTTAG